MKNSSFWKTLKDYFTIYLPKQRNSSVNTIEACHKTWNLLLRYIGSVKELDMGTLSFQSFSAAMVTEFLDYMECGKKWSSATRNQRLSCIRSFFKYAAFIDPMANTVYADLLGIPKKAGVDKSHVVAFMTKDAMSALLSAIDISTKQGVRDRFFLTLMYDSAARDGEMLKMQLGDLDEKRRTLYLFGKGSKPRIVPISSSSIELFQCYKKMFHAENKSNYPMFYTIHAGEKTPMSDDNVARFLKKYAKIARNSNQQIPEHVHPHMFRHSRAMHLYQGGMPLSMLSEFLGHENPETTLIYAHADTEMKRNAVEKASQEMKFETPNMGVENIWKNPDIVSRLIRGY